MGKTGYVAGETGNSQTLPNLRKLSSPHSSSGREWRGYAPRPAAPMCCTATPATSAPNASRIF